MSAVQQPLTISRWLRYVSAVLAVGVGTTLILPFRQQINSTTVGLGYLLIVLFVAILGRSGPALIASLLAMLCFNFFFLPPFHTFTIADPQNWVALIDRNPDGFRSLVSRDVGRGIAGAGQPGT